MDWIFSHLDDLESMDVSEGGRSAAESEGSRDPPPGPRVRDGPGSEFHRHDNSACSKQNIDSRKTATFLFCS